MAVNGFNIDSFKSNYQDLARQYTFMIMLSNPFGTMSTDSMKYLVSATSMPGSTIDPIDDVSWQGHAFPLAATHSYDDWEVTFRMDNAAKIRTDFLLWDKAIHDPETNEHSSPTEYMQNQEIWQLDTRGGTIMKLRLVDAWPTSISELTLDYSAKSVSTFSVTFKYVYSLVV